ncbi:RlpA-like double-psi beta-barrel domain-containing protein [Metabacillus idriensis]|uniref:hypothetical protein n=1 Tax=Metabacillus idriensis TaxID=324768 RepID=UPI0008AA50FD|nr:hypothetical protein [Metabacillus idriensis]MCM3598154.1 RlpA-like double-psi beta-barrel domain-containing protein [Metabacillus idriensis]OHR63742.1 hypothetical protein HMPREF3291_03445 [Bacillus sp. HMSC76G11]
MATYYGVASWHSDSTGAGMCKNWDNNAIVGAYPHVYEMNSGTCNLNACGRSLVRKNCGSTVNVTQPCNPSRAANVKIAGCGPRMSSFCGDAGVYCKKSGYTGRIIDLSPSAFAFLGDVDYGTMTIQVQA